jgi:hypothetical protein
MDILFSSRRGDVMGGNRSILDGSAADVSTSRAPHPRLVELRGQTRLTQMNQQVADNIEKIITALENDQPQEVADAS